jgi:hypothetical protein
LLNGFSFSLLPQLYQDAVYITRHLSIRYLWIDSLCIIQDGDDSADWRHEVGLMDRVSSNSFCNMSALDAPNSNHTLFCSRNPDTLRPEIVNASIRGVVTPYLVSDLRFWDTEVYHALLNTRAWVLQERLLSQRILHFSNRQLLWECRKVDAAEINPEGLPDHLISLFTHWKSLVVPNLPGGSSIRVTKPVAYLGWMRIAQSYRACHLTFPSDKIAALSAIAKIMSQVLSDEYVAGMWRRNLENELLWNTVEDQASHPTRSTTYRAPSWSWMAVNGPIFPGNIDEKAEILIKVESFHLDYCTDDITHLIRSGWLRLRGVLKQLTLILTGLPRGKNERWRMAINGMQIEPWPRFYITLDDACDDFDQGNADSKLYCMPGKPRKGKDGCIYILLLEMKSRDEAISVRLGLLADLAKICRRRF